MCDDVDCIDFGGELVGLGIGCVNVECGDLCDEFGFYIVYCFER